MKKKFLEILFRRKHSLMIYSFGVRKIYTSNPRLFVLLIVFTIIYSASISYKILVWKNIINDISSNIFVHEIYTTLLAVLPNLFIHLIISIFIVVMGGCLDYIQFIYSEQFSKKINLEIIEKVSKIEMEHFDRSETYDLIKKANQHSLSKNINFLSNNIELLKSILTCVGITIIVFNYNLILVFLCYISIIPLFYINNKFMRALFETFNNKFENMRYIEYLKNIIVDNNNIKEIKIMNTWKYLKTIINETYDVNINLDRKVRKKYVFKNSAYSCIDTIITYCLKIYAIFIGIINKSKLGNIIVIFESIDALKNTLENALSLVNGLQEDILYVEFLYTLLHMDEENSELAIPVDEKIEKIVFENVSFRYKDNDKYTIKNFSFTFEKGKSYAIVGVNGSGKTTIIKLLVGLYKPTEGHIYINGKDLCFIDKKQYYNLISVLFQDFVKYPLSVSENIFISDGIENKNDINIDSHRFKKISELLSVKKIIDKLPNGWDSKLLKGWNKSIEISAGEWQKIGVFRSLIRESELLIFDEPTADIDLVSEKKIFDSLNEFKDEKIYVLISHRLFSIKDINQILVIDDGILVETGTHENLLNNETGIYRKLYSIYEGSI